MSSNVVVSAMRLPRHNILLACIAAFLCIAVTGEVVVEAAASVFHAAAEEHQDCGEENDSDCGCVCHQHQTAMLDLQIIALPSLGMVSEIIEQASLAPEAPATSIEYPPQLV